MASDKSYAIRVATVSQYRPDQSHPNEGVYVFAYTITITNVGEVASQLISRHWIIEDANGRTQEVKGLGVVGHQPLLRPGESFEYTSGTHLETPNGQMRGSYFFVADNGTRFEAEIPGFDLAIPRTLH